MEYSSMRSSGQPASQTGRHGSRAAPSRGPPGDAATAQRLGRQQHPPAVHATRINMVHRTRVMGAALGRRQFDDHVDTRHARRQVITGRVVRSAGRPRADRQLTATRGGRVESPDCTRSQTNVSTRAGHVFPRLRLPHPDLVHARDRRAHRRRHSLPAHRSWKRAWTRSAPSSCATSCSARPETPSNSRARCNCPMGSNTGSNARAV